jgi:hypothetical protein
MLDCERFSHHRANTVATAKPRKGHQQVTEQWNSSFIRGGFLTLSQPLASLHSVVPSCQNQQFATHRFWLLYKRLEAGTFAALERDEINARELYLLLEGIEVARASTVHSINDWCVTILCVM